MDNPDKPSLPLPRLVRAPIVLTGFVLSLFLTGYVMSCVSVGTWVEAALARLGVRPPGGVPAAAGVVGFTALGFFGAAWLGYRLVGWPGAVAGPPLSIILVGLLDHW